MGARLAAEVGETEPHLKEAQIYWKIMAVEIPDMSIPSAASSCSEQSPSRGHHHVTIAQGRVVDC